MPLVSLRLILSTGCQRFRVRRYGELIHAVSVSEINSFYRAFDAFGLVFRDLIQAVTDSEIKSLCRVFNTFGFVFMGN